MPNWTNCRVTAPEDVLDAITNSEGNIDFNLIIPQPECISEDGMSAGVRQVTRMEMGLKTDCYGSEFSRVVRREDLTEAERIQVEKSKVAYEQTGYFDWYDWRCGEWGTKWNACHTHREYDDTVQFDTAWDAPRAVMQALANKFNCKVALRAIHEDDVMECLTYSPG